MLRSIALLLLWSVAASVSAGQNEATGQAPSNNELRQQYASNLAKSEREQEESHQRNAKIMARTEALLTQHEKMMKREKRDFARFEKILDTWERQQAQYQKYLDSLGKK